MEDYVKKAVEKIQRTDTKKVTITLKNRRDYKKHWLRLLYNKFVLAIQQKIVPCYIKNFLLRTTGMRVGHDVCIPHDIYFDSYFPELIYLEKGCLIGGESKVYTHELKGKKLILGKVVLKERTLVGGMGTLKPGFVLNKNSMLMFFSESDKEVPEGELWGGQPAKLISKLSPEEIDKYFKPSNRKYKEYYKDFKKQVMEFMKDPTRNYLKIHYNGKRLNAGDDWWRARNVFRIWYNGIIIEITRFLPHFFLKTWLLRAVGIKIGRNCKIGYGVVFDHIYGDNVTLEDNVRIDEHCYLDGHEYTISQTVFGKILIKKGVHLKHHSYVRVGTTIGENTIIESYGMAQREIPANEIWGGMPAKFIKKR